MFRILLLSFLIVLCASQQGLNATNKVGIERDEDVKKAPSMSHRVNPIQMEKIKKSVKRQIQYKMLLKLLIVKHIDIVMLKILI